MNNASFYVRVCLIVIGFFIAVWFYIFYTPIISQEEGITFFLRPGISKKTFIKELSQQHITKHTYLLTLYTLFESSSLLKTGEYHFPKGSTLHSLWKQVTLGKGLIYHPFTIVPGWSFLQLRRELLKQDLRHDTASKSDQEIMASMGYADFPPEGEFFPETYYYTKGISDLVILKEAFQLMQSNLNKLWANHPSDLPYKTEYEALIAASLIEKEAYLDSERPIIAGVLINRLQKNMLLQFDPTVIYGLGPRYSGKLHKEDLADNNIYNTYIHRGLPPTPIAMPSLTSLYAAIHPQKNDFYYFVAKGDGSHQFSKTLPEHNSAVEESNKHLSYFNEEKINQYSANTLIPEQPLQMITAMLKGTMQLEEMI